MRRLPHIALLIAAAVAPVAAAAPGVNPDARSATIIGPSNALLSDGAAAMEAGDYELGVRLTIDGLRQPNAPRDEAAGHANLCAAYGVLKRWSDALVHCNRSLQLDRGNWRAFNNRAAVFVAQGQYDLALADVSAGLELAPSSDTLLKSRQIVLQHKRVFEDRRRSAVQA